MSYAICDSTCGRNRIDTVIAAGKCIDTVIAAGKCNRLAVRTKLWIALCAWCTGQTNRRTSRSWYDPKITSVDKDYVGHTHIRKTNYSRMGFSGAINEERLRATCARDRKDRGSEIDERAECDSFQRQFSFDKPDQVSFSYCRLLTVRVLYVTRSCTMWSDSSLHWRAASRSSRAFRSTRARNEQKTCSRGVRSFILARVLISTYSTYISTLQAQKMLAGILQLGK